MKLLIVAQSVDENNPALGFFVNWVREIAKHFEEIVVICLEKGAYDLPSNVRVLSLGKELGASKLKKLFSFYFLLFTLRKQYDAVFVHMIQEFVLMGGFFWKLFRKPIYLWRNHYAGSIMTSFAGRFCRKVFYTSKFSYTAKFKNAVKMPVGVPDKFAKTDQEVIRRPNSILFLARLDPSKRPETLIRALGLVGRNNLDFSASFIGKPSKTGSQYVDTLKQLAKDLNIDSKISFEGEVPNNETFRYYRSHDIFVNCSRSGMFDKTLFEACLCGCLVLASSKDFKDLVGSEFVFSDNDIEDLSRKLSKFLSISPVQKDSLRKKLQVAGSGHNLSVLVSQLVTNIGLKDRVK